MKDSTLKRKLVAMYEVLYEARRMFVLRTVYRLNIMTWQQTARYIKKKHCSIARFGDGEFDHILGIKDEPYQQRSEALSQALLRVLQNKSPNLLLCVPYCFNSVRECNDHSKEFWISYDRMKHHQRVVVKLLRDNCGTFYRFGDSQLTRPYIDWKTDKRARKTFAALKDLWDGRDLLIVEGQKTCLGIGNDLFDNTKSIQRIIGPAIGAFDHYQEIYDAILRHHEGKLILMALGPTASILASDLANAGIQALDIGHIDIEYEWYRMGATERVQIPGKYTNEAMDKSEQQLCDDAAYLEQIIERIG